MSIRWLLPVLCSGMLAACASVPDQRTSEFCILSVEESAGTLAILSKAGARLATLTVGERPHEVEVSHDRRTAYVSQFGIADYDNRIGTPGNKVVRVDLGRRKLSGEFVLPADVRAPHGLKLRPPSERELFTNAEVGGDTMLVYDVRSGALLRRFPLPKGTHNFVFSPDGTVLFSFAGAQGVSKIDAVSGRVLARSRLPTPVRGLFIARNGQVLAGAKGAVFSLRHADLSVASQVQVPLPGQLVYLAELQDGTVVAPALADGAVVFLPANGGAPRVVPTGKAPIFAKQAPDGQIYVANVEDRHLSVLTPAGTAVRQVGGLTTPNGLGFGRC